MNKEKVLEILKDQAFATKILEMQTPEQVQAAFKEKGVEISVDEVKVLGEIINKMIEKNTSKLSPADLDEIAGGFDFKEEAKEVGKGLARGALDALEAPVRLTTAGNHGNKVAFGEDKVNKVAQGAAAVGVMAAGAGVLMAAGAIACKGVEWGIKKIRKK